MENPHNDSAYSVFSPFRASANRKRAVFDLNFDSARFLFTDRFIERAPLILILNLILISIKLFFAMKFNFFIGTMNRPSDLAPFPPARGIYAASLDVSDGSMSLLFNDPAIELESPTFVGIHPNKNILYAVSSASGGDSDEDLLTACRIKPDGRLEKISQQKSGGKNPCHVSFSPDGRLLFAPNYSSGTLAAASLNEDGEIGSVATFEPEYSGDGKGRQEASHPHCFVFSPNGRFAVLCDLGSDRLWTFQYDSPTQSWKPIPDRPFESVAAGSGPRHAVFSRDGKRLFVFNELSASLDVCQFEPESGRLAFQKTVFSPKTPGQGAEIVLHPNGRFIYLSTRVTDAILVFREESEGVSLIQEISAEGEIPRFITFDPTGKFLLSCCQKTGRIFSFEVNPQTGRITPAGQSLFIPWCACLAFAGN